MSYIVCDVWCMPGQHGGPPGALIPISRCGASEMPTSPQPTSAIGCPSSRARRPARAPAPRGRSRRSARSTGRWRPSAPARRGRSRRCPPGRSSRGDRDLGHLRSAGVVVVPMSTPWSWVHGEGERTRLFGFSGNTQPELDGGVPVVVGGLRKVAAPSCRLNPRAQRGRSVLADGAAGRRKMRGLLEGDHGLLRRGAEGAVLGDGEADHRQPDLKRLHLRAARGLPEHLLKRISRIGRGLVPKPVLPVTSLCWETHFFSDEAVC